ncbi:histidine kinase [Streptomyces axinellae]|uniref:histidine kinase n=1 Tax=Streptomyces axinellae TaxID=552788 RepID=A0ABP6CAJ3_9ACTN
MRRETKDRAVDIAAFLFAAAFSVLTSDAVVIDPGTSETALLLDQTAGGVACAALFLRRRWPVQLTIVLLVAGKFSHFATGAILVALFTVAASRTPKVTGWVTALAFAPVPLFLAGRPAADDPATASSITYFALIAGALGWGSYTRSRRQLVASLHERAERAADDARREARENIAREMHDVLAHRLSLLSVHAGALEFNPGGEPAQVARAAGVVRQSAHEALEDLREIIGVLRAPEVTEGPQPVLADVEWLAAEARQAGAQVTLQLSVEGGPEAVASTVGRTAYRVVQEGLTNARKHGRSSGAPVTVRVRGAPGAGLTVTVLNPAEREHDSPIPGAGQGLIGLAERTTLAGGHLEHGWVLPQHDDGPAPNDKGGENTDERSSEFRLFAWLPWPE